MRRAELPGERLLVLTPGYRGGAEPHPRRVLDAQVAEPAEAEDRGYELTAGEECSYCDPARRSLTKSATAKPISDGLSSWTKWTPLTVTSFWLGHWRQKSRGRPLSRAPGTRSHAEASICEAKGIELLHCAPYIRKWMSRERGREE